ncbi:MAG TPA: cell division protein FtsZ, partial [Candidatus Dojkabacteria bacterium]|nr:cell division protein FtsZ [Candidatus Dojkabacteria bacterium]
EEGIAALKDKVDTLIVVPNQKLVDIIVEQMSFLDAMKRVDRVLAEGVKGISGLVTGTGFINVDFADVKSIMQNAGTALMGIGSASGENRAEEAARAATTNPLLELSIEGATGVLYNITGGVDLSMQEVDKAAELIAGVIDPSAHVIFGVTIDPEVKDEMAITIVATGFDSSKQVYSRKPTAAATTTPKNTQKNEEEDELDSLIQQDQSLRATSNSSMDELDDVPAFMRKK